MDTLTPHRWLEGALAIGIARQILTTPGTVSCDFETYPTSPKWHRRQAAAGAERGQKVKAGDQAELDARLNGRAHKRTACTLQLHHSDGSEVFVRLRDPATELPAMFAGHVAHLVAHNAQFETEILIRHGVEADVECTLVAAKCLYLVAVPEDEPQPVEFSLAALVARELGRSRDKTIRDRDWQCDDSLDSEAVEYGLQDVRDTLQLWLGYGRWLGYERLLRERGLFTGYRVMQGSILPTAAINVRGGLVRDQAAHTTLIAEMQIKATDAADKLDRIAHHAIANPGSDAQVSTWINEQVLGYPIKAPVKPKVVDLKQFLRSRGGLRPDPGGELAARNLGTLVQLVGMSLEHATITAEEYGYIRPAYGSRCEERDLLAALDLPRCLTVEDQMAVEQYEQDEAYFQAHHVVDPERKHTFNRRLDGRTRGAIKRWHTTKTGHLGLRRGSSLRKAEIIREAFPKVAEYLVQRSHWRKAQKLIDAFGATLSAWDDGIVRGQHKVYGAWTGRQSCADPNLQNQPHDDVFRAVWVAHPGRKLVIADYSQIELRLLAIEAKDERLMDVYRQGRDVHQETADIAGIPRQNAKNVNFAMAYGSGAAGLSENFGFQLDESKAILTAVLGAYPGLAEYRQLAPAVAAKAGYISIRPDRRVKYDASSPGTTAINAPIQGGAASVQNRALRLVYEALPPWLDAHLAAAVHDEIIVDSAAEDAEDAAAILVEGMTKALIEIYPEAETMGLARLTAALICDRWSAKT